MKKKALSQSAFFNLRVLIGLFLFLCSVFLALLGFGTLPTQARQPNNPTAKPTDPLVPALFDCSRIRELGIDMQENLRAGAIMIYCGEAAGGEESPASPFTPILQQLLGPLTLGTADVDLITGTETPSHITQSETFAAANPDNPLQIVIAYNDSRGRGLTPVNISGASVSTDGGNTFTRLTTASGQGPFANTAGDPVVLYNKPLATWYTVWLDGGCGGQGLGGYKSTTPWDPNSWTHYCVHNGGNDDRESGWVDNNPASPFFGRMYVSWNDFARGQNIFIRYSTDNGVTWTDERQVSTAFYRNVQITGDMGGLGTVYIAAMDEMNGGLTTRVNRFYRSTDGGNTWTNTYVGPSFPAPGRSASGFFATMFSNPAYWRHQGWGQPAALNGVVHYVYDARDTGSGDPANVFYIRSTDDGVTFSTPFQLNTDTDSTKAQWQPNLSVTAGGSLLAVWYDERERVAASCQPSSPGTPCYRMWARKSTDNGATWLADDMFSDVVSPLPLQPDSGIVATYVGDYDYGSPVLNQHLRAWADGRVPIGGASQQDAFFDREPISAGLSVITSTPACNSVVSSQPTDFVINVTDPVNPATLQGSDFTVNGIPADSVVYTSGTTTMTFHFNSTPVTAQGSQTMHIPAGAFNRASDGNPVFDFTCTFRYDALQLQVTSTVPAVGGAFSPPAPGSYTYDVNFNEVVDPASIQTSDLTVSGNSAPSVVAVTVINGNTTARFTLNMNFGGTVMASIAAGAITDPFGNPGAAFSGSYTVDGCPPQNHYNITQIGGSIVPGVTDTGNHTDDGLTTVPLPFSYNLYDMSFSSVNVSSNGNAQFVTVDNNWTETCLPWITPTSHNYTIFPYWDDQCTGPCTGVTGTTYGIFTSISGSAPNRIFNIEWRTAYYNSGDIQLNYELRLYEGQSRFDVIYGTVPRDNTSATAGVQKDNSVFDQFFCDGTGAPSTGGQSYILQSCGTPTPTATATATATGTPPPTPTPSPCSPIFSQNFDGVVAPALPQGWVASNPVPGDGVLWATSTTAPDTAPNDAFIPDQDGISDKVLFMPNIAIPSANSVISFRNNFDTEFSDGTYWDGFVLEVSSPNIAGGNFLDITDPQVGGSFVTGGYTGTLSTAANNPLAGRMAWSSSSGGYINTAINLGPNVAGQTIRLRFRMGSDEAVAAPGVRIDTLVLTSGGCGTPTPTATATATATLTATATATVPVETPTPTPSPSPTPTPTVTPTPTPSAAPAQALNLSTRMLVLTGDQVGIGGFIITGTAPKQVLVRGIGPSLSKFGVPNPLADPATELHGPGGFTTLFNNNWRDTQEAEIQATGLAPTDNLESAILATLDPGNYTAVVKGHDNGTGVGLVEVFDLDAPPAASKLGNISTRAFVNTGADIMIAGFILAGGSGDDNVILRGIGPSLSKFGVPNVLNDPTLELRDSNGALVRANDNWQDDPAQAAIITAAGLALSDPDESGIAATLSPGQYTALLSGVGGGVGNGLVEAYDLGTGGPKP